MSAEEAHAAARQIVRRRTRRRPDTPPDVDQGELREVAQFVRRHPAPDLAREECADEVTILVHLAGELDRWLYDAISLMRQGGATWREVAAALRVRSPQAAEQTWLRMVDQYRGNDGTRHHEAGRQLRHRPDHRPAAQPRRTTPQRPQDALELRQALLDLVALASTIPDSETAEAIHSWRVAVEELPGPRLASHVQTLLPVQLEGAELPRPVQVAVDRAWASCLQTSRVGEP